MSTIVTKSNKVGREIELEKPLVLETEDIDELIEALGKDVAMNLIKAQLTIGFRSHIRSKLESETDGEQTYTDEDISQMDFSDWKPEARTRMSAEEKAYKILAGLAQKDPEKAMAALESMQNQLSNPTEEE